MNAAHGLFDTADRERINASSLARHAKRIIRFAKIYGPSATEALDDVLSTLRCGDGYAVEFTSRMYRDAWELIEAVGPDAATLIAPFVLAYQHRRSAFEGSVCR
jgi:hypothetical protein